MEAQRIAVLIPAYNNCVTLPSVISGALAHIPDVLVVNDGSTDDTERVLGRYEGRVLVEHHSMNRGKGAALRTGFEILERRGFTHAITIDADGQHLASDLPAFVHVIEQVPGALVIGTRDLRAAGAPARSRFGLWCSNMALRLSTGRRIADSQTGFRAYPLRETGSLALEGQEYDLEMEMLAKSARRGWQFASVPIQCTYEPEGGRVTHFQPVRDFLHIGRSLFRR